MGSVHMFRKGVGKSMQPLHQPDFPAERLEVVAWVMITTKGMAVFDEKQSI